MKKNHIHLFLALIVCTCSSTWVQAEEDDSFWLPRWSFRRPLTVRAEVVANDLTNFPVLVRLDATNFDFQTANAQGNDVRFVLPDGTPLAHDRERHDAVNEDALYWVRLPVVSAIQDTVFHLYYGNDKAADGTNSHDVWTADYVGVWHLNDTNGTNHLDATSNQLHGTVGAAPLDGEGLPSMIGGGVRMIADNKDQYIITTNTTIDTTHGLTLSAWVRPRSYEISDSLGIPIIHIGGGNWSQYYTAFLTYRSVWPAYERLIGSCSVWDKEGGTSASHNTGGFSTNVWHHAVATFYYHENEEATNTTVKLYLNGTVVGEKIQPGYALRNRLGPRPIGIGASTHNVYPEREPRYTFDGMLDEVRVASTVRSDAWIKTSYLNQKTEDELLLVGDLERQPTGLVLLIR